MARPPASPLLVGAAGIALLCAMDAVIKYLGQTHAVVMIAFGRYAFGALISGAVWLQRGRPAISRAAWRFHAMRGLVLSVAAYLFFVALTLLPFAEAIALSFIAPLLIPIMAQLVLRERMRWTSLVACAIGGVGVLIATQGAPPAADTPDRALGLAAVLSSAVVYALSAVLLRARAAADGPVVVSLLAALVPATLFAPFAILAGGWPAAGALPWFAAMGLLGTGGMLLITLAYGRAEAQALAPLEFTALGWAALFGFAIFGEQPRIEVLAGAAVIVAACLFAAWDERRRQPLPSS